MKLIICSTVGRGNYLSVKASSFQALRVLVCVSGCFHLDNSLGKYLLKRVISLTLPVWHITWMSGYVHALGQVDGYTWTSDCHAPGQVPSPTIYQHPSIVSEAINIQ